MAISIKIIIKICHWTSLATYRACPLIFKLAVQEIIGMNFVSPELCFR